MLPPTTATDVQIVCPIVAPTATPTALLWVASCRYIYIKDKYHVLQQAVVQQSSFHFYFFPGNRIVCSGKKRLTAIVAIWLRSPHSAKKVKMNDCTTEKEMQQ